MFRRSSAVEQLTVNQLAVGSIPTAGAIIPLQVYEVAYFAGEYYGMRYITRYTSEVQNAGTCPLSY
jgi:hypothetical protein